MKKYTNTKQKSYAAGRRKRNARRVTPARAIKMKLKKGDQVIVVSGKDKGKTGAILSVLPRENKVTVDGVAMAKRHFRKTGRGQSGRIVEHPAAISASNVMLVDPETKKQTRVGRNNGARVTKKSTTTLK